MNQLITTLNNKKSDYKNEFVEVIDELIDIIKDIDFIKYIEDAKVLEEELKDLLQESKSDEYLITIIQKQLQRINEKIPNLILKKDPILEKVKILEKNSPHCTNKNCSNKLVLKIGGSEYFWTCPDFPRCWGKKKLTNEEFNFIYNNGNLEESTKNIKKIKHLKKREFDGFLYEKLRQWRIKKSSEKEIPAYIICNDSALEDICQYFPLIEKELLEMNGIGEKFIVTYGNEVLDIIINHYKDKIVKNKQDYEKLHKKYLNTSYQPNIKLNNNFTEEEIVLLKKFGSWFEALDNGLIEPFTIDQVDFIIASKQIKVINQNSKLEKLWIKYKEY